MNRPVLCSLLVVSLALAPDVAHADAPRGFVSRAAASTRQAVGRALGRTGSLLRRPFQSRVARGGTTPPNHTESTEPLTVGQMFDHDDLREGIGAGVRMALDPAARDAYVRVGPHVVQRPDGSRHLVGEVHQSVMIMETFPDSRPDAHGSRPISSGHGVTWDQAHAMQRQIDAGHAPNHHVVVNSRIYYTNGDQLQSHGSHPGSERTDRFYHAATGRHYERRYTHEGRLTESTVQHPDGHGYGRTFRPDGTTGTVRISGDPPLAPRPLQ